MSSDSQTPSKPQRFWTPVRLALTLVAFALLATVGISSCTGPAGVSNANPPKTDATDTTSANKTVADTKNAPQPLPDSVLNEAMQSLDGEQFKLSDYKGKVLFVNLWATWCGPCRAETPELVKLSEEYKAKGVEFIGLTNEDPTKDAELVKGFVQQFKVNYKIGWSTQNVVVGLMQGQIRNSIPQSFILTREGRVYKRFVGFSPVQTPPQLRQALDDALNVKG